MATLDYVAPALRGACAPYDPLYDPLVSPIGRQAMDYAPTYWVATAGEPPDDDGPLSGDADVDVPSKYEVTPSPHQLLVREMSAATLPPA